MGSAVVAKGFRSCGGSRYYMVDNGFFVCAPPRTMGDLESAEQKEREVKKVEVKAKEKDLYNNVPLSLDLKKYIVNTAEENGVKPSLVFAVIEVESNFNADTVSETDDYGLMQLNGRYEHLWRDIYGVEDLLDPFENVKGGIKHLARLKKEYKYDNLVLMAYNMGESAAEFAWSEGQWTSGYADRVLKTMSNY